MKPSNESSINKNQLLGIDRFKMCIPSNFLKKGYTKYFNMKQIYIKNRNKEKNIYSKIYYLNSSLPKHICIFLSITFSNSRGGNSFMLSKNLCIDINVPKYIYGNNIYESTFSDLMNTIQQIIPILTDFVNIYDLYANTEIYYLESGVGIYSPSSHNLITFCYQNTRSYNKNKIKLEPYVNGGLGCYISNKHKKLSYYDKNLEIKHSSPDNPILSFLTKNNIEITRMEVKYSTKQEVRKLAKKYLNKDFISLYDLLFTNITPLILQEEWLKQKEHMNIYDLSTTDVNKIFTHIVNSKLSKKIKRR